MGGVTDFFCLPPQQSGKYAVEGAHPKMSGLLSCNPFNAVSHFSGGFVGEGEGQDLKRISTLMQNLCDAVGENPRFTTSGPGHDHYRAFGTQYGLALGFVECVEV
jgi:hypothetical protein